MSREVEMVVTSAAELYRKIARTYGNLMKLGSRLPSWGLQVLKKYWTKFDALGDKLLDHLNQIADLDDLMWSKTYLLWLKTDQRHDLRLDMQSWNKGFCFSLNITAGDILASITHHTSPCSVAALFGKVWRFTGVSWPFRFDLGKGFEYITCKKNSITWKLV